MPVSSAFVRAVPGGAPALVSAENELIGVAQASGARVLRPGEWSVRYFADAAHLNQAGTTRFTRWFSEQFGGAA
jgi:hypothetical protein